LSKMTPAQERQFWEQFERDLDSDTGEAAKAHLAAGRPKPALSPVTLPTLTFSVTGIPLHYRHYPHVPRVEVRHVSGQASTFKFLTGSVLIRALAAVLPEPHRMTRVPNSLSVIPLGVGGGGSLASSIDYVVSLPKCLLPLTCTPVKRVRVLVVSPHLTAL